MKTFLLTTNRKTNIFFTILFLFVLNSVYSATYYSKATGNANTLATWGLNTDGSGTAPSNFTTSGDIFIVRTGAALTMNGSLTFGSGVTLQVIGTVTIAGGNNDKFVLTVDGTVEFNGTSANQLIVSTNSGNPQTINTFALGSTATLRTVNTSGVAGTNCSISSLSSGRAVVTLPTTANYEFNGASQTTLNLPATVNNLTFSGSGTKTLSAAVSISSNLSISSGVDLRNASGTARTITMTGTAATLQVDGTITGTNIGVGNDLSLTYTNASSGILTIQGSGATCLFLNVTNTNTNTTIALNRNLFVQFGTFTQNGILQINNNGSINIGGVAPTYGASSALIYNVNASYTQSNEWTGAGTTVGLGVPNNVTVKNNTNLTLNASRGMAGNLSVEAGSTLQTSGTLSLATGKAATINGTFQINQGGFSSGGNNWTYGSTATLIFNNTSGSFGVSGTPVFWPLTSGPVNVTVQGGTGGGITMSIPRTITGLFQTNGPVTTGNNLAFNGSSAICQLNNGGGFASGSPSYTSTSTLRYNTSSTFARSFEWTTATSGNGYPGNVEILSGTILNYNDGGASGSLAGNLTIASGAFLYANNGGGSASITVAGNVNVAGLLNLGASIGSDLTLSGNWTLTGTFTPNGRTVIFNGTSAQSINGATTFSNLSNTNTSAALTFNAITTVSNNLSVASSASLNLGTFASTAGSLTLNGAAQGTGSSYGGTGSPAANINPTFFANNTGYLNVGTCGTYSITSIAAAAAVCVGNAATINVTSSVANLPNGTYTVFYSLGTPNIGIGNTTMTVSGGTGSGSFTTTALANSGNTIITINLIRLGCVSVISSGNTATITVNANPTTSTNGGNKTACVNTTSAALGGNTPSVGTGLWTCTAAPSGGLTSDITFTSATTGNTTAIVASGAVAGNYTLAWTISNSPCTASVSTLTLAVSGAPTTSTNGGNKTACVNTTSAALGGNTPSVGTGLWTCTAAPSGGLTSDITFTSATTGNTTAIVASGAVAGNYTLAWTISNSPCTASVSTLTLAVSGAPTTAAAGSDQSLCAATTATLAGNTPSVGTGTWTVIAGGGSVTTPGSPTSGVTGLTVGTNTFRWTISNGVCTDSTDDVDIIIYALSVGGTVTGGTAICSGSTSALLTLTGYTGTIVRWESSVSPFTVWTPIANTTTTYTSGALTQDTQFRAVIQNGVCPENPSIATTVTVNTPSVAPTSISGTTTICNGGSTTLTAVGGTLGTGANYQWGTGAVIGTSPLLGETSVTLLVTPSSSTTYWVQIENTTGPCTANTGGVSQLVTINTTTAWSASAVNTNWTDAANWTCGIPFNLSDVTINAGTNQPTIASNVAINSLTIASGAIVTVTSGFDLLVTDVVANAGTLNIQNTANLLQVNNVSNTGAGTTNVFRNSSALKRLDYTLWCSPVSGSQTLYNFSPLTNSTRYYEYLTATDLYAGIASSNTFNLAKGYLIRMPNNWPTWAQVWTGQFSGTPNNGAFTRTMSTANNGYNAVGNPYPSALDVAAFIDGNSGNIEGTLWFWRKTNDSSNPNSYSTITKVGPVLTFNTANGNAYPDASVISTGQGFIVKATTSTLNYNNSMRSGSNVDEFFKTSEKNRYWLELTNSDNVNFGQNLIAYVPNATLGYDNGYDGLFIGDTKTTLLTLAGDKEVVIQARPEFDAQDIVPLIFKAEVAGTYAITISSVDGIFEGTQIVYLKDNLTNTTHNLSAGSYTFTSEAGNFMSRFVIVYQNALSVNNTIFNENNVVVYKKGQDLIINSGNVIMDNVKVFDVRGRLLFNKKNINASEIKFNTGSTNQVLLVKITSDTHETVTKKVVN